MDYYTQKDLLKAGWSKKKIEDLLGRPDQLKPNPYNSKYPPMKLYDSKRVECIHNERRPT